MCSQCFCFKTGHAHNETLSSPWTNTCDMGREIMVCEHVSGVDCPQKCAQTHDGVCVSLPVCLDSSGADVHTLHMASLTRTWSQTSLLLQALKPTRTHTQQIHVRNRTNGDTNHATHKRALTQRCSFTRKQTCTCILRPRQLRLRRQLHALLPLQNDGHGDGNGDGNDDDVSGTRGCFKECSITSIYAVVSSVSPWTMPSSAFSSKWSSSQNHRHREEPMDQGQHCRCRVPQIDEGVHLVKFRKYRRCLPWFRLRLPKLESKLASKHSHFQQITAFSCNVV